eukprot:Seg3247.3 transcript_id=Seg3247.3/GoldUCD/mRNA.D3Y31 product="hypothetical protein" protein_id=Seg3247.3/GoldUCD/D3Y31
MSGVLRHAFRRLTLLRPQTVARQMSNDAKQIEGGNKPHSVPETVGILVVIAGGLLGVPTLLMLTREKPTYAD